MDKILEFEKGNSIGPNKYFRFQCDCLTPLEAMDIEVGERSTDKMLEKNKDVQIDNMDIHIESNVPGGKYFVISMWSDPSNFKGRIKEIWGLICGRRFDWREFTVRQEDLQSLSDLFNPSIPYDNLP